MIRRAMARFDRELGKRAALREIALGLAAMTLLGCDMIGLLLFIDALGCARP